MSAARRKVRRGASRPSGTPWPRPVFLWMTAFAVLASVHVWLRLQTTSLGYELEELHRVEQRLADEHAELEVAFARLTSPRSLDRVARERLGLGPPQAGQVVGVE